MRSYKPCKNISVLAGTVVKKTDFFGPSKDAQNVCAIAKESTALKFCFSICIFAVFFFVYLRTIALTPYLSYFMLLLSAFFRFFLFCVSIFVCLFISE